MSIVTYVYHHATHHSPQMFCHVSRSMSCTFLTCAIHVTNILLLTSYICLYSPCNMPVFFLSCDICLSVLHVCSTHTELTYTTLTHTTYIACYPPCIVWSLQLHNKKVSLVYISVSHAYKVKHCYTVWCLYFAG